MNCLHKVQIVICSASRVEKKWEHLINGFNARAPIYHHGVGFDRQCSPLSFFLALQSLINANNYLLFVFVRSEIVALNMCDSTKIVVWIHTKDTHAHTCTWTFTFMSSTPYHNKLSDSVVFICHYHSIYLFIYSFSQLVRFSLARLLSFFNSNL